MMRTKYFSETDLEKYLRDELDKDIYNYVGVYLHVFYKGYRIDVSSHDDLQDILKAIEPKVNNFLK